MLYSYLPQSLRCIAVHWTPPIISKQCFCWGVSDTHGSNIRGPWSTLIFGSLLIQLSNITASVRLDGLSEGKTWWRWYRGGSLKAMKPISLGYFHSWGDAPMNRHVWWPRGEIAMISHRLVTSFWISGDPRKGAWLPIPLLQSVPWYAKDRPRPRMRWMLREWKKCRDIETSKQDDPWCCYCFLDGGGKRSHGRGACMPTLASNIASRFPDEAERASPSQS